MMLFKNEEVEGYLSRMVAVKNSLMDYIEFDSELERDFAAELDQREDIRFFVKLPDWFRVKTPLGDYNPDWAIVKEDDRRVYLVRETKGTTDLQELRPDERGKIKCGERHFQGCLGVSYKVVKSVRELD